LIVGSEFIAVRSQLNARTLGGLIEKRCRMLAWAYIIGLLVLSAIGAYRLRAAASAQYARFVYGCAVLFGLIPVITGDWQWALLLLPAALVAARVMLRHRAANFLKAQSEPPAT
jgi:hypothetical protein